jgi:hypothetical protein
MFKRNPDVIALVLIVCALIVPRLVPRPPHVPDVRFSSLRTGRANPGTRLRHTVASLKQCLLHPRSQHRPIVRSL